MNNPREEAKKKIVNKWVEGVLHHAKVLLEKAKTLEPLNPNKSTGIFGGKSSGILNWNDIAYPHWYKMYKRLLGNYWQADEVNMSSDVKQFPNLTEAEQDAYLKIIGLLSTLDAPQTRTALLIITYMQQIHLFNPLWLLLPSKKPCIMKVIHMYYLLLYLWMNKINHLNLEEKILFYLKRNENIMKQYNEFVEKPTIENILKTLVYTALLEGMFFYSGFAFFYNLARHNKMVGTSTMISYINRDELEHGRFISELFRATLAENPEYNNEEFIDWVYDAFKESVELEIEWSEYVLSRC